MPLSVPALRDISDVQDLQEKMQAAEKRAHRTERAATEARTRAKRLEMNLAEAVADDMLGETPDRPPASIRADLNDARDAVAEAEAEAEEAERVLDMLTVRAPKVWERVHDEHKRDAFERYADLLEDAADALESALDSLDAVDAAPRGNRWLSVASDRLALPRWITANPKKTGSCARLWIKRARERAERLRDEPQSIGTGYTGVLNQLQDDAEAI